MTYFLLIIQVLAAVNTKPGDSWRVTLCNWQMVSNVSENPDVSIHRVNKENRPEEGGKSLRRNVVMASSQNTTV